MNTIIHDTRIPQPVFVRPVISFEIPQNESDWNDAPQDMPALMPTKLKRRRQPSFTTILRQARRAGADRVEFRGATIHLADNGASTEPESVNEWDQKYGHH